MIEQLLRAVLCSTMALMMMACSEAPPTGPAETMSVVSVSSLEGGPIYPGSTVRIGGCFDAVEDGAYLLAVFGDDGVGAASVVVDEDGAREVVTVVPAVPAADYELQLHAPGVVSNTLAVHVEYPSFMTEPEYQAGERTRLVIERSRSLAQSFTTITAVRLDETLDSDERAVLTAGAETLSKLDEVLDHIEGRWEEQRDEELRMLTDAYSHARLGALASPNEELSTEEGMALPFPEGDCGTLTEHAELLVFYYSVAADTGLGVTQTAIIPGMTALSYASTASTAGTSAAVTETVIAVMQAIAMVANAMLPVDLDAIELSTQEHEWSWERGSLVMPIEIQGTWGPQGCVVDIVNELVDMFSAAFTAYVTALAAVEDGGEAAEAMLEIQEQVSEDIAELVDELVDASAYMEELEAVLLALGVSEDELEGLMSGREFVEVLVSVLTGDLEAVIDGVAGEENVDAFCEEFLHSEMGIDASFYQNLGYDTVVSLTACHLGMDRAELEEVLEQTSIGLAVDAIGDVLDTVTVSCGGSETTAVMSGACEDELSASGFLCLEVPFEGGGTNMVAECAEYMQVDFRAWVWKPYDSTQSSFDWYIEIILDYVVDSLLEFAGGDLVIPHAVEGDLSISIDADACIDRDGDGFVSDACGQDCDAESACESGMEPDHCDSGEGLDASADPSDFNPCAEELEDGWDNDCDGVVDEQTWVYDDDGDCYCEADSCSGSITSCAGLAGGDCDDADANRYPGAPETGTEDMNCDDLAWPDLDGDGYDDDEAGGTDCDDRNSSIHPGMSEVYYDGVDDNCDPSDDDDQDGDGYAVPEDCQDDPALGGANIHPGASESWYDGVDQNCDGGSDYDQDGDGYEHGSYGGTDCDDVAAEVNPGEPETCDGIDNNCDGDEDDASDAGTWYRDSDGDGYGDEDYEVVSCETPSSYVAAGGDCDDDESDINPGEAEVCEDEIDNDCDGAEDEGCECLSPDTSDAYDQADEAYTVNVTASLTIDLDDLYFGEDGAGNEYWLAASFDPTLLDAYDPDCVYVEFATIVVHGTTIYDSGSAFFTHTLPVSSWHGSPSDGDVWGGTVAASYYASQVDYSPDFSSCVVEFDVTTAVQAWLDGSLNIEGFLIKGEEYSGSSSDPFLHMTSSSSNISLRVSIEATP